MIIFNGQRAKVIKADVDKAKVIITADVGKASSVAEASELFKFPFAAEVLSPVQQLADTC